MLVTVSSMWFRGRFRGVATVLVLEPSQVTVPWRSPPSARAPSAWAAAPLLYAVSESAATRRSRRRSADGARDVRMLDMWVSPFGGAVVWCLDDRSLWGDPSQPPRKPGSWGRWNAKTDFDRGNVKGLERGNGTRRARRGWGGTVSGAMGDAGRTRTRSRSCCASLKERSGLSYGTLAKRLHMSTSTLHRYCNGSAVPTEYAPAERLARVCRATPEELVELHRRWILADAARGRKRPGPGGVVARGAGADEPEGALKPEAPAPTAANRLRDAAGSVPDCRCRGWGRSRCPGARNAARPARPGIPVRSAIPVSPAEVRNRPSAAPSGSLPCGPIGAVPRSSPPPPRPPRWEPSCSPRICRPPEGDGSGREPAETVRTGTGTPRSTGSARPHDKGAGPRRPLPPRPGARRPANPPPRRQSPPPTTTGATASAPTAYRLNVATRPYVYDNPCSQHFLVDQRARTGRPARRRADAPRWAAANGAVSSGEQRVALTVQGTGKDTVVLEALHVRVVAKGAPLAWNDYSMGVGCGGDVETESFDVDLDDGSPTVTVKNGQRDFPYKVSESDPEVFYVTAHTKAHDVRWDLALDWSSGGRHGTVHIDNSGTPFRTSADTGRPGYDYPLGGSEWIKRVG